MVTENQRRESTTIKNRRKHKKVPEKEGERNKKSKQKRNKKNKRKRTKKKVKSFSSLLLPLH